MLQYFDTYETMKKKDVLSALAALAQETRLDVFRRLVQAGPVGMPAGALATELGASPAPLSFAKTIRQPTSTSARR